MCGQAPSFPRSTTDFRDIYLGFQGVCILCALPVHVLVCVWDAAGSICLQLSLPDIPLRAGKFSTMKLKKPILSPIFFQSLGKSKCTAAALSTSSRGVPILRAAVSWWQSLSSTNPGSARANPVQGFFFIFFQWTEICEVLLLKLIWFALGGG